MAESAIIDSPESERKKKRRERSEKMAEGGPPNIKSYNVETCARLLEVTERHIQNLIKARRLQAWRLGKRGYRVTHSSLERYIAEQTLD